MDILPSISSNNKNSGSSNTTVSLSVPSADMDDSGWFFFLLDIILFTSVMMRIGITMVGNDQ